MEDTLRQPSKKKSRARACMYLRARLAWLWGYPLQTENNAVSWQQLYYPMPWDTARHQLCVEDLASASVSCNRIIRDFPVVLVDIVGDVGEWKQCVTLKLQALRALINGKQVRPLQDLLPHDLRNRDRMQRRAASLIAQSPALAPIVESFVWWLSTDPKSLSEAIEWLSDERHNLVTILRRKEADVRYVATLFTLSKQTTSHQVARLVELAAHPIWFAGGDLARRPWFHYLSIHQRNKNWQLQELLRLREGAYLEEEVTYSVGEVWMNLPEILLQKSRRERRQNLRVIQMLLPVSRFSELLDLHNKLEAGVQQLLCDIDSASEEIEQTEFTLQALEAELAGVDKLLSIRTDKSQRIAACQKRHAMAEQFKDHGTQLKIQRTTLVNDINDAMMELYPQSVALELLSDTRAVYDLLEFSVKHESYVAGFHTILKSLPSQHEWAGAGVLVRWVAYCLRQCNNNSSEIGATVILRSLLHYWKQAKTPELLERRLKPWAFIMMLPIKTSEVNWWRYDEFKFCATSREVQECRVFLPLLGQLCERIAVCHYRATVFQEFWEEAPAHWNLVEYFAATIKSGEQLKRHLRRSALYHIDRMMSVESDGFAFSRLARTWGLIKADDDEYKLSALPVAAWMNAAGYGEVVEYYVTNSRLRALAGHGSLIRGLSKLNVAAPAVEMPAGGFDTKHFPVELQASLQVLVRCHDRAEHAARRILSGYFPCEEATMQEIAHLEALVTERYGAALQPLAQVAVQSHEHRIRQRLNTLQQRLLNPEPVTPARLQKLAKKLEHAAYTRFLERWAEKGWQQLLVKVAARLGVAQMPAVWMQDERRLKSLVALCELEKPERELAGHLLKANIQKKDLDLRSFERNRQWLNMMVQSGFSMQAWLNSEPFYVEVKFDDRVRQIRLQFAEDFFDILEMGDHFNTCLSRDDFNFFSVIANAADANKRVLYGYSSDNKIIARCLIGITEEQKLVSFHLYSHARQHTIDDALSRFMEYLEREIGIERCDRGKIPRLVSNDWYDDGIETPMPKYPALDENSQFMTDFSELTADTVLTQFERAISPSPLTEYSVLQLLQIGQMKEHVGWVFAIHRQLIQRGLNTTAINSRCFDVILESQPELEPDRAWHFAKEWIADSLYNQLCDDHHADKQIDFVVRFQPQLMLRITRRLLRRMKIVCSSRSDILVYQARALSEIGRLNKAHATYQMAVKHHKGWSHISTDQINQELSARRKSKSGHIQIRNRCRDRHSI